MDMGGTRGTRVGACVRVWVRGEGRGCGGGGVVIGEVVVVRVCKCLYENGPSIPHLKHA